MEGLWSAILSSRDRRPLQKADLLVYFRRSLDVPVYVVYIGTWTQTDRQTAIEI